jgi:hypothetical protein
MDQRRLRRIWREAQVSEIDPDKLLWTIPAERTKRRREMIIPLPPLALELMAALPRERSNPHLFIGRAKAHR